MSENISRLSVNIPTELHKFVRHMAIYYDQTVTDLVIAALQREIELRKTRLPNKETLETFQKSDRGEEITRHSGMDAMFKSLGL